MKRRRRQFIPIQDLWSIECGGTHCPACPFDQWTCGCPHHTNADLATPHPTDTNPAGEPDGVRSGEASEGLRARTAPPQLARPSTT